MTNRIDSMKGYMKEWKEIEKMKVIEGDNKIKTQPPSLLPREDEEEVVKRSVIKNKETRSRLDLKFLRYMRLNLARRKL